MLLLVFDHCVLCLISPLQSLFDLCFQQEPVAAQQRCDLLFLELVALRYRCCEPHNQAALLHASDGGGGGHGSKVPPKINACLSKTEHPLTANVPIFTSHQLAGPDSTSGFLAACGIVPTSMRGDDRVRIFRSPTTALVGANPMVRLKDRLDHGPGGLDRVLTGE